jgi:RNA polymerase sigma factor (sigma-70 family)
MPRSHPTRASKRHSDAPGAGVRSRAATWIQDHLDAVYRYARRRLPAPDADDVAQQCFEALFRAEAEGRAPEDAGAYLLGVARRRVADVFRRAKRRPEPVALPPGWEGFGEADLPASVLEDREVRALVAVALGFLPEREASLLTMRYRGGASTEELADRLGLSAKAVENRLRRARAGFLAHYLAIGGEDTASGAGADERPAPRKGDLA